MRIGNVERVTVFRGLTCTVVRVHHSGGAELNITLHGSGAFGPPVSIEDMTERLAARPTGD